MAAPVKIDDPLGAVKFLIRHVIQSGDAIADEKFVTALSMGRLTPTAAAHAATILQHEYQTACKQSTAIVLTVIDRRFVQINKGALHDLLPGADADAAFFEIISYNLRSDKASDHAGPVSSQEDLQR